MARDRSAPSGPTESSVGPFARELVIRWRKSAIGQREEARRTLFALGLRRLNQRVVHADTPQVRGMVARVRHLVEVEEREARSSGSA